VSLALLLGNVDAAIAAPAIAARLGGCLLSPHHADSHVYPSAPSQFESSRIALPDRTAPHVVDVLWAPIRHFASRGFDRGICVVPKWLGGRWILSRHDEPDNLPTDSRLK
jgi:hypothetical protein